MKYVGQDLRQKADSAVSNYVQVHDLFTVAWWCFLPPVENLALRICTQ